jgi:hypothetical protein
MIHGRNDEAEKLVSDIEADVERRTGTKLEPLDAEDEIEIEA